MTIVPEKIDVLWFLPTHGESRYLGTSIGGRIATIGPSRASILQNQPLLKKAYDDGYPVVDATGLGLRCS